MKRSNQAIFISKPALSAASQRLTILATPTNHESVERADHIFVNLIERKKGISS
jgi:hypothetical protein